MAVLGLTTLFLPKKLSLEVIRVLKAIDLPGTGAFSIQSRYVTLECCNIKFTNLFQFTLCTKKDSLYSPKWIHNLLLANHSQTLAKLIFNCLSMSALSLYWRKRLESSAQNCGSVYTVSSISSKYMKYKLYYKLL